MTTVVHVHTDPFDIYIGGTSRWGNPYAVGPYTRSEAIDLYSTYLMSRPDLVRALPELRDKVLGCWCAPKPCHGNLLATLADHPERILWFRGAPVITEVWRPDAH